ncbi:condensation domain-containing protein [Streptomyces minutiscleroticus]|nr:condensation domain-containing protein [Streptomyces minutiscleroticus]
MYWYQYHLPLPVTDSAKIQLVVRMPDAGLPEGLVTGAIEKLMLRHEALRTVYPTDSSGKPFQLVLDEFETPVPLRRDGNDLEDITAVFHSLFFPPMDQATELPLRVGYTLKDRRVATVILVLNHISVDAASLGQIRSDLISCLDADSRDSPFSLKDQGGNTQPLAVARQQSTAWASLHERSMQHCERALSISPAAQFPHFQSIASRDPRKDFVSHYHRVALRSSNLFSALQELTTRNAGFNATNHLFTAFAVAVSALSGIPNATLRMNFSNRFREVRRSVGCFFQETLVPADLSPQLSIRQVMVDTRQSIRVATRHAQYSYLAFRDRKAKIEAHRGLSIRLGTVFNCSDRLERSLRGPASQSGAAGERPKSTMERLDCLWRDEYTDLCLRVSASGGKVHLDLIAHRSVMEQAQIEKMLSAMELFLIAWANDPDLAGSAVTDVVERFGLPTSAYGEKWAFVDNSWVDTAKLAQTLRSVEGVEAAVITVAGQPSRGRILVAHVAGNPRSEYEARAHVLAALRENVDLVCPHEFVWSERLPESGPVTAVEPAPYGDAPETADASRSAEDHDGGAGCTALATALEAVAGDGFGTMDRSYIQQGGTAVMAPAVINQVHRLGFEGPTPDDLLGPWPLRTVAELCTRRVGSENSSPTPAS